MVKKEMDFYAFVSLLEGFILKCLEAARNRQPRNYKRGVRTMQELTDMYQSFEIIRTDMPPSCSGEEARGRLFPEKNGNPLFFHKVVIDAPLMGKPSLSVVPMSEEESLSFMEGKKISKTSL